jgi:hypothetical protein
VKKYLISILAALALGALSFGAIADPIGGRLAVVLGNFMRCSLPVVIPQASTTATERHVRYQPAI